MIDLSAVRVSLNCQIVRRDDLTVYPAADMVLTMAGGALQHSIVVDDTHWCGALACHALGFSALGLSGDTAARLFAQTTRADELLAPLGGRLLPGGAHPFMDPARETWIWNHDRAEMFSAMDRVFGLKRQAWSNQGSLAVHIPFANEEDFARIFAALRLVAAIMPALAASSPLLDGRDRGWCSERTLAVFGRGEALAGFKSGPIPEPAATYEEYQARQIEPLRRALAQADPEGLLDPARLALSGLRLETPGELVFDLVDLQECPRADLALAELVVRVVERLSADRVRPGASPTQAALLAVLRDTAERGENALIAEESVLAAFGFGAPLSAGQAWRELARDCDVSPDAGDTIADIFAQGTLAGRIRRALGEEVSLRNIRRVYGRLCDCQAQNALFTD